MIKYWRRNEVKNWWTIGRSILHETATSLQHQRFFETLFRISTYVLRCLDAKIVQKCCKYLTSLQRSNDLKIWRQSSNKLRYTFDITVRLRICWEFVEILEKFEVSLKLLQRPNSFINHNIYSTLQRRWNLVEILTNFWLCIDVAVEGG